MSQDSFDPDRYKFDPETGKPLQGSAPSSDIPPLPAQPGGPAAAPAEARPDPTRPASLPDPPNRTGRPLTDSPRRPDNPDSPSPAPMVSPVPMDPDSPTGKTGSPSTVPITVPVTDSLTANPTDSRPPISREPVSLTGRAGRADSRSMTPTGPTGRTGSPMRPTSPTVSRPLPTSPTARPFREPTAPTVSPCPRRTDRMRRPSPQGQKASGSPRWCWASAPSSCAALSGWGF